MAKKTKNKKKKRSKDENGQQEAEAVAESQSTDKDENAGNNQPGVSDQDEVIIPEKSHAETDFRTYQADAFTHEDVGLSDDDVREMYRSMLLQRRFEERSAQMYGKQKIAGFLHLYIGQEAVSTGTVWAMNVGKDSLITAYRDHGIALAMGMTANECMAELFGKIDGCSRGKGGSMHFFDKELRMMGGHGIVGGHIPVGTGLAFAHKYKEDGNVCLCFFGDGAVAQGSFHEAMNLAGLYDLPIVFVIENNQYAMGTSVERAFAQPELHQQSLGYNIPGAVANGMDVFSVHEAMKDHLEMAHDFQPSILEVRTYRYRGHSMSDPAKYRTKEELEQKKNQDPIIRLKSYILDQDLASNESLDEQDEEIKQEVLDAVEFAEESDPPALETIYEDIYPEGDDHPYLFLS